ncbi:MAG: hypothetical protein A3J66_01870 [Candidatus Magasanikbacteria bacterium RIFCSPHIGHO2_02_FULL_47_14]|uniref:RNA polymerase sigma factor 70 region 4 type 2 domain-containing protein n=1 Tax=Candidatus Magasanikbacteria bacterium RIFCSPHIGHO2_02_FULL_47_14 TaxID=1798680 RepID=A0A1F6M308_9BACT|nr:MAG: hypothetical protein A3J66_01870 [Candidatus Magasanikbacteria bacterium RIFCSPHIGHO2_02_FULL_47_14]
MSRLARQFDERRLLYRIITKKDPDAFAKVYDQYIERIYRFVYFKISSKEEAEDITSDVFLRVWNYLVDGHEKQIQSLSGLLYTTARHAVIDAYRERAKRPVVSLEVASEIASSEVTLQQTNEQIEQKDTFTRLVADMRSLKQEYQEVLLLRYVEELSVGEIAVIVGKSKTNVRVLLHRSLKKLKEQQDTKYI